MKKSDKIKYSKLSQDKLFTELVSLRQKLVELKIKNHLGQVKDTSEFKKTKHLIAYINTLLNSNNANQN